MKHSRGNWLDEEAKISRSSIRKKSYFIYTWIGTLKEEHAGSVGNRILEAVLLHEQMTWSLCMATTKKGHVRL